MRQTLGIFNLEKGVIPQLSVKAEAPVANLILSNRKFIERMTLTKDITMITDEPTDCYKGVISNATYFLHLKGLCKIQEEIKKVNENLHKTKQTSEKLKEKFLRPEYQQAAEEIQLKDKQNYELLLESIASLEESLKVLESFR